MHTPATIRLGSRARQMDHPLQVSVDAESDNREMRDDPRVSPIVQTRSSHALKGRSKNGE